MSYKPFKMKGNPMKRNFGVGSPNNLNNFGIGPGGSPWRQDETTTNTTTKDEKEEEVKVDEQGGGKSPDKPWIKALKAATTMLSGGIAGVYGGTRHVPKINWGKYKKEEKTLEPAAEVENLIKTDTTTTTTNGEKEEENTYIVQAGDGLNKIAKANNTTVENLIKKNPDIKDINSVIHPGQNIIY